MSDSVMGHVFTIEGERFVAGLLWQPLAGITHNECTAEIKVLSDELKLDLFVIRTVTAKCAGFVRASPDIKPGVCKSAAAAVSKAVEIESGGREFILASPVEGGGWLYVAQREGIILPDGDVVYQSEDAIRSRLLEDIALDDWGIVFAPGAWGIKNSSERTFADLLPRRADGKLKVYDWWSLQPSRPTARQIIVKHKKMIAGVVLALLLSVAGVLYLERVKAAKMLLAEQTRIQKERETEEANRPPPPLPPWARQHSVSTVADACLSAFGRVRLFPGNWTVNEARCENGFLTVTWKPNGKYGWIEHLRAIEPDATIAINGSTASISVALLLPEIKGDEWKTEQLPLEKPRLIEMYSIAQRYGVNLITSEAPVATGATTHQSMPGQVATEQPEWKGVAWRITGMLGVAVLVADGDVSRMKSMTATLTDKRGGIYSWTIEGTQYVKQ